jgi:hypothetical protein
MVSAKYSEYEYVLKVIPFAKEEGGIANELVLDIPLPSVSSDRQIDTAATESSMSQIVIGSNVARGPDWPVINTDDGGIGNVGLVWAVTDTNVTVLWPNGKQVMHRYGFIENKVVREIVALDRNADLFPVPTAKNATSKDMENVNIEAITIETTTLNDSMKDEEETEEKVEICDLLSISDNISDIVDISDNITKKNMTALLSARFEPLSQDMVTSLRQVLKDRGSQQVLFQIYIREY